MSNNAKVIIKERYKFFGIYINNLISFVVWPFGTIIWAFRHLRSHQAKSLFFLFCVYFGFAFILPRELIGSLDAEMYALDFIEMHENPISFGELLKSFYSLDAGNVDIVQPLLTWIVASITGSTRVLFMVFALVFGYFFTQNLWIVFDRLSDSYRPTVISVLLISLLFFINPIWNINGFRFYTASHVFVFGLLNLYLIGNKNGWIWILFSALVHFSFIIVIPIFLIYCIIPKKPVALIVFFYIAFSLSSINLVMVQKLLTFLPWAFVHKLEFYTNPDYARMVSGKEWALHIIIARWSARIIGLIWVTGLFIFRKHWINLNPHFKKLLPFILYFGGIVQIMNLMPSGIRFITVFNFMLFALVTILVSNGDIYKKFKPFAYISIPFMLVYLVNLIRAALEFTGFLALVGNPVIAVFVKEYTPLARYLF